MRTQMNNTGNGWIFRIRSAAIIDADFVFGGIPINTRSALADYRTRMGENIIMM